MNKAHIKLLQDRYVEAVNGYVAAYNDKNKMTPVCWLHGSVGGTLLYEGGLRVDFQTIKKDIDGCLTSGNGSGSQTDEMNFMEKDEVCGNCKNGEVQSDSNYCRCTKRGTFQKYLDPACNIYEGGDR